MDAAVVPTPPAERSSNEAVTWPMRVASAWAWRFLLLCGAVALVGFMVREVSSIFVAVLVAMLLAVLLGSLVKWTRRRLGFGRSLAAAVGLLVGLLVVSVLMIVAITQLVHQVPVLIADAADGLTEALNWLRDGPLGIEVPFLEQVFSDVQTDITALVKDNSSWLASGALAIAGSTMSIVASSLIMLFCLFFFLRDGRRLWIWAVRLFPGPARSAIHEAGIRGWVTLGGYVRTQIQVAAIDALGIGIGAFALGVPLAIPITVLVFMGAFVPIVGAFVSGAVAVLIALVNNGLTTAIVMLVVVLVVQQLEGNVLQPWLMGNAVSLHPVAVLLAVAVGSIVAGIPGAIFAVPFVALLNVTFMYLHGHDTMPWLATDEERPGGPPGSLERQLEESYARSVGTDPRQRKRRKAAAPKKTDPSE